VDTLPAGFSYVAGSTTGGTTTNPSVSGAQLTWTGPFTVPANGSFQFHFSVTVSSTPGHYTNSVTATATFATQTPSPATVAPALDTAPIDVALVGPIPSIPVEGIPLALATAGLLGGGLLARDRRRRRAA
jgi:hypothetical protein